MAGKLRDDEIRWILSLDAKGLQSEIVNVSTKAQDLTKTNEKLGAELKVVEKDMDSLQKQMAKLSAAGDTSSDKFERLKKAFTQVADDANDLRNQIDANKASIDNYNKKAEEMVNTLKVGDMTMGQLKQRAKELEKQLESTSQATDPAAYADLEKRLNEVRGRMGELDKGSQDTEKSFSFFSSSTAKGLGIVVAGVALAKKAFSELQDLMLSNKATGEGFKAEMDGISNALDYVQTAIANLDFTNFFENVREANRVGREMSLVLAELFERTNAFKLTSAVDKAEIETLKTDLRDVNLTSAERLKIGEQIIEKTRTLAAEEKNIAEQKAMATKELLRSQTQLTDAEMEYTITNYNSNREAIKNSQKLIELENKRSQYKGASNQTEIMMNAKMSESLDKEIDALKNSVHFSEIAYLSMKKYSQANNELIGQYVDASEQVLQIDIKTERELRRTQTMMNQITNKGVKAGETKEQKELAAQKKEFNLLQEKIETTHRERLAKIKQDYLDGDIKSESEFNRKIYAQEQANFILRETSLKAFIDNTTKEEVKSDINKKIAEIQDKRLAQEIDFRKKLENIILDADPLTKEKRAYEERLRELGVFGESVESLRLQMAAAETEQEKQALQVKLSALELLEKQHLENVKKIKESGAAQAKKDAEARFQEDFKAEKDKMQLELNELMATAAANPKAFDAEMSVHTQRMKMINDEIDARRRAGVDTSRQTEQQGKLEANMTSAVTKELQKRTAQFQQYGNTVGQALGNVMTGQTEALRAFGDASVDIVFDILSRIIEAELIKVMASSTSAIMRATAESMATPQSALSFGAAGFATAAILTGAITAATVAAKVGLKALLGKKNKSSSGSTSESGSSGQMIFKNQGFADGGFHEGYTGEGNKYDIKGYFPDGQPYHAGEYIIPQEKLKYPSVASMVRQIDSMGDPNKKKNPLPRGFAEGGFHSDSSSSSSGFDVSSGVDPAIMQRLVSVLDKIESKGIKALVGATELQTEFKKLNDDNNRFTRSIS